VLGLLALQGAEAWRSAGRRLGFLPDEGERGVVVGSVEPDLPADRAGVRAGDRILAVAGRPVAGLDEYESVAERFQRGRPVRLRIDRAGEVFNLQAIPGVPPRRLLLFLSCLTALGFLAVAILVLTQGLGDPRGRLLFGFAATVALEIALPVDAIGHPFLDAVTLPAYCLLTGLQIGLHLHLAAILPERAPWLRARPWIVFLFYGAGLGLGVVSWSGMGTGMERLLDVGLPLWAVAVTLLLASQALRQDEPQGRQQAGLVLAATIPWMLFVVGSTVIEQSGVTLPDWTHALETLILLGYPAAFFAAIFRYDLFDIERAARRGLIYTTLTGALMLVFYASLGAGGVVFSHLVGEREPAWSAASATLLLGLLFAPLRRFLHRGIGRRFFPERDALRGRLIALAAELPALGKLPRMGAHLVERTASIFSARSAALLLADPETGEMSVLAATPGAPEVLEAGGLAVPLLSRERPIGRLVLGGKEGSRSYPAEERDLLNLLAHHAATVFENARLFQSATYEGLTGLLRREAVLEQLDRELERAARYGRPLAVAMADLDHFKRVNDRHGHLAGDALLRQVSQILSGSLRGTDWIGRYGGEEFLLVLPETGLAGAAAFAEKIRGRVEEMSLPVEDGPPIRATVSIGLAALDGERKLTARDLIAEADRALYEAKNAGRNRVACSLEGYPLESNDQSSARLALEEPIARVVTVVAVPETRVEVGPEAAGFQAKPHVLAEEDLGAAAEAG
jgi:diguanylate cyclase (GGDEF)-like protein